MKLYNESERCMWRGYECFMKGDDECVRGK